VLFNFALKSAMNQWFVPRRQCPLLFRIVIFVIFGPTGLHARHDLLFPIWDETFPRVGLCVLRLVMQENVLKIDDLYFGDDVRCRCFWSRE